jgi:hypothetical protein
MPNPEHLAILKQGVEIWNGWRKENLVGSPDFMGADLRPITLSNANLAEADLTEANLSGVVLEGANLRSADLTEANLWGAHLYGADLSDSILFLSNLCEARLKQADLRQAGLQWANLTGALLSGAHFGEAVLGNTVLANVDLSEVEDLESCRHDGPSSIDFRTLLQSGTLPLAFLRGCGLPDILIDYLPSLINQPLQLYSCFISHSTRDQEFVERLHADLQNHGVRCWYAPKDAKGGRKLHDQIDQAIRIHDKLLLVLSDTSMDSSWVQTEIKKARRREIQDKRQVLFPISITNFEKIKAWSLFDSDEGRDLAEEVRSIFIPDFSNWKDHDSYQKAFERLLRDLKPDHTRREENEAG